MRKLTVTLSLGFFKSDIIFFNKHMKKILILILFFLIINANAAYDPIKRLRAEINLHQVTNKFPYNITKQRSIVIVLDNSNKIDLYWKEKSKQLHKGLILMNADPTAYVHIYDFYSNTIIHKAYLKYISKRKIMNMIVFDIPRNRVSILALTNLAEFNYSKAIWSINGNSINDLLYRMGLVVKRNKYKPENFLIPGQPEFIEDINIHSGETYENYPSIIARQKVGFALFEKINIPDNRPEERMDKAKLYNASVDRQNEQMKLMFYNHEYNWKAILFESNIEASRKGFQYVYFLSCTSGLNLRQTLDYPTGNEETHYMTTGDGDMMNKGFRRIVIEATELIHKGYLHQVISDDIFVGREWDAHTSMTGAIKNFFYSLENQFKN